MEEEKQRIGDPFKYSILWTWDHSTNWDMTQRGMQESGCANPYLKRPEAFLSDYRMVVDFAAEHGIGGIIIWGFVRDSHGGVEYTQELCRYAAKRGVRILPGVGTSVYGGFYYEGEHRFSTQSWTNMHPELCAVGEDGQVQERPCPSRPEYQEWLREGAAWLYDTFEIGGINLEHGDFAVCYCEHCRRARGELGGDEADYYKDMAISERPVMEVAHEKDPDTWITYATYTGFDAANVTPPPRFPEYLPEYAVCQWTLTKMYAERTWAEGLIPPTAHSVGYFHQGSQWWGNPKRPGEGMRHCLILQTIRDMCAQAAASKLEGVAMHGEVSPLLPQAELNYLGFEYFTHHPGASLEDFFCGPLRCKLGGEELALKALEFLRRSGPRDDAKLSAERSRNQNEAKRIAYQAHDDLEVRRCWGFILEFLATGKEMF